MIGIDAIADLETLEKETHSVKDVVWGIQSYFKNFLSFSQVK